MEPIKWQKKYSVGIPEIDFQHRFFFLLIERLESLINKGCDKLHISNLMNELAQYAVFHFTSEENRMLITNYENIYLHKMSHIDLIQKLNVVKARYDYFGTGIDTIVPFLTEWLINHTISEDLKLAQHMKQLDDWDAMCTETHGD